MFYWIISTLLDIISTIYRKKALWYNVPPTVFQILAYFGNTLLVTIFILFSKYDFSWFNYIILFLILLVIVIWFVSTRIGQYAYTREKISTITPYENINSILSIILAFFIFSWEISIKSFILTITAWLVVIISSIDFNKIEVPKVIKLFSFQQLLKSISLIVVWYILKQITPIDYYIINSLIAIFTLLILIYSKKELWQIISQPKSFYKNRFSASFIWSISWVISLFIIKDLWVWISILLGYLYIIFILTLSYIFLWDKPSTKNIITTIIVSILVWFWYYYK